jgi:hypothetical protein
MPVIYLEHPVHGNKVATLDIEADFDEQNGWKRYNPDTPSDDEEVALATDVAPVVRRGRRKKTEESVETLVPNFLAPQSDEGE